MSWKNAYLENYIEERLEGGVEIPKEELIDELKSINKYVYNIQVFDSYHGYKNNTCTTEEVFLLSWTLPRGKIFLRIRPCLRHHPTAN